MHALAITIDHVPEERPCLSCGLPFEAAGTLADCPRCGGIGAARPRPERIEIEWGRPAATADRQMAWPDRGAH